MQQEQQISIASDSKELLPETLKIVSYEQKIIGEFDEATLKLFGALQNAHNFFKGRLFDNRLSSVILTLNRKFKSQGYYMHSAWLNESNIVLPEINISPEALQLPAIEVMSILVHEMAHHFQYLHGYPGRGKYHNKGFAKIMEDLGLICSATGKPGGRPTGERMGHYILAGGRFENVFHEMPEEYILPFKSYQYNESRIQLPKEGNKLKIKYHCNGCGVNVWGRPNLTIICGDCKIHFSVVTIPKII